MAALAVVGAITLALAGLTIVYALLDAILALLPPSTPLTGKAVLVTGCDTGLGRLIALHLASRHGAKVFAGCLTEAGADSLRESADGDLTSFLLDVTSDGSVDVAVGFVRAALGGRPLFGLINNAGIAAGTFVEFTTMDEYRRVMEVNFLGGVRVAKAFLPLLVDARGRVVNITSAASLNAAPSMSAYAASKFATAAFSDSARRELAGQGVRVVQVAPGFLRTNMTASAGKGEDFMDVFRRLDPAVRERYGGDAWAQKAAEGTARFLESVSGPPETVLGPVVRALTSRFPKARYICGVDARLVWSPLSRLPTRVQDALVGWFG